MRFVRRERRELIKRFKNQKGLETVKSQESGEKTYPVPPSIT
jgi:hypothetical protein